MIEEIFHLTRLALSFGRVERGVSHPDGKPESDTDHSISLAWVACSLAAELYPELDLGLIAQYAVVHDAVEIYAGDTYAVTAGDDGRQAQKVQEDAAYWRLKNELRVLSWLPETIQEYETQETPEALFVRTVDKLMPKVVLRIEGRISERMKATPEDVKKYRSYEEELFREIAADFPELDRLRKELNGMLTDGGI